MQNKGNEIIQYCYAQKLEKEFGETYLNHSFGNSKKIEFMTKLPRQVIHNQTHILWFQTLINIPINSMSSFIHIICWNTYVLISKGLNNFHCNILMMFEMINRAYISYHFTGETSMAFFCKLRKWNIPGAPVSTSTCDFQVIK